MEGVFDENGEDEKTPVPMMPCVKRYYRSMLMQRIWYITTMALLLSVILAPSWAAEPRKWNTLTNCQYVDSKDNDGDSFRVKCGTDEFIARLYFVDAPETNLRYPERTREQSEYFGVTIDETMKAGRKARDAVQELLREPFVIRTRRASAAGRSIEPRYYALIEVGGKSLAEILVSQGLARTKGVIVNLPTGENWKAYVEKLRALESEARQKRLGVWGSAAAEKIPETQTR
jgi:endonuclease YncB( thermonuclease family)